jgi:UDP-2,3-diacylglucosamine pyrophosphatase LpxH
MDLPQYDELHVISDIHMGGAPGFQILRETKRLAGFIRWVEHQSPDRRVALVLNGDIVDTLAEPIDGYVAVNNAVPTIDRIMQCPEFSPIWDALAAFVRTVNRTLVIVLGNHDIELCFPSVQRLIINRLAGDDLAARARIEFSTMGAGFPCRVGHARVFCTHGNEVDPWNYVRYEDLAKAARRISTGRLLLPSEWEPNAGTKLVKDVMNEVKVHYRWIDLLKPETQAAVGVLLVLDPKQLAKINRLWPVAGELVVGSMEFDQRLSVGGFRRLEASGGVMQNEAKLLGPNLLQGISPGGTQSADEMLLEAERTYKSDGPTSVPPDGTLGSGQLIWDRLTGWLRGVSEAEALRRALKDWLAADKTFNVNDRDLTSQAVVNSVGTDIDFIITGHTHLERAIAIGPSRYYFNTGTWIRLLQFTDDMLASEDSFQPVYQVLRGGQLTAIDAAVFGGKPFVLDQTSSVRIRAEGTTVIGELVHVTGDGTTSETIGSPFRRT